MKNNFEVNKLRDDIFFINLGEYVNDQEMCDYLQITIDEYRELAVANGADPFEKNFIFYKTQEDADKTISDLKERCADILVIRELESETEDTL